MMNCVIKDFYLVGRLLIKYNTIKIYALYIK